MRFAIFQSVQEALVYGLLLIVLVLNIIGLAINISVATEAKSLAAENSTNTREIEKQQNCIAAFFLQPNRTDITLANLGACADIIQGSPPN